MKTAHRGRKGVIVYFVETAHNKLARCSQVYKRKNRDLREDSRPASKRKIENRTQKPRARRGSVQMES